MILKKVEIKKYKSFEEEQSFNLEDDITILVGMNESGKTAALEAIAKTNYFENDTSFQFDATHDYPRKQKKRMDKSGVVPEAITCTYEVSDGIVEQIEDDLGEGVVKSRLLSITTKYDNSGSWVSLHLDRAKFIEKKTKELGISSKALNEKLKGVQNLEGLQKVKEEYKDEKYTSALSIFEPYFQNEWKWKNDALGEYVARKYLKPLSTGQKLNTEAKVSMLEGQVFKEKSKMVEPMPKEGLFSA